MFTESNPPSRSPTINKTASNAVFFTHHESLATDHFSLAHSVSVAIPFFTSTFA